MSNLCIRIGVGLMLLFAPGSYAQLLNGTFADSLFGWKAAWPVVVREGEAVLADGQTPHVFLFQAIPATAGVLDITFDFENGLSDQSATNAFRDSFYASLYEVADPADFITEHDQFAVSHGLMDLDASGPFDVQGTISDSPDREDWLRFTGTVAVTQPYAVLVFELYDLNFVAGDSTVRLDNVELVPGGTP